MFVTSICFFFINSARKMPSVVWGPAMPFTILMVQYRLSEFG